MRKQHMHNVSRHDVNTTWKKKIGQFCIYIEIDLSIKGEQSWLMEGICLIWSRGRHFSLTV